MAVHLFKKSKIHFAQYLENNYTGRVSVRMLSQEDSNKNKLHSS